MLVAATACLALLGLLGCVAAEAPEDDGEPPGPAPLDVEVEHPSDVSIRLALESAGIVIGESGAACGADTAAGSAPAGAPALVTTVAALGAAEMTPHRLLAGGARPY